MSGNSRYDAASRLQEQFAPKEQQMIDEVMTMLFAQTTAEQFNPAVSPARKQELSHMEDQAKWELCVAQDSLRRWGDRPEHWEVMKAYPAMDPKGKFSIVDIKAAERQMRLDAALQSCDPDVVEYVRQVQQSDAVRELKEQLLQDSQKHRLLTRTIRQGLQPELKEFMWGETKKLETGLAAMNYAKLQEGLEYVAGMKFGLVPQEIRDFFANTLQTPLREDLLERAWENRPIPEKFEVKFENLDNRLLQQQLGDPDNWDKAPEDMPPVAEEAVVHLVDSYAGATADRLLDTLFPKAEALGSGTEINRGDLIIIDGKTVRERIYEAYLARQGKPAEFDAYYAAHHRELTNDLVAAGLMADKQVEVFVPDKTGKIPENPTPIVRTGYEPMQPVTLNAWERFWSKYGFYKTKTMQAAAYQRMEEARERVKVTNYLKRMELLNGKQPQMRGQFARAWETQHGALAEQYGDISLHGSMLHSLGVCAMLQNENNTIEDVFHPGKLQAEKAEAGARVIDALTRNNNDELAQIMAAGHARMVQYLDDNAMRVDFADDKELYKPENGLLFMVADAVHDVIKAAAVDNLSPLYEKYAAEQFNRPMSDWKALGHKGWAMGVSTYLRNVRQSLVNGVRMAGGLESRSAEKCLEPIVSSQIDRIRITGPHKGNRIATPPSWSLYPTGHEAGDIRSVMFAGHGQHLVRAVEDNPDMRKTIGQQMLNGQLRERMQVVANQRGDLVMNLVPLSKQATQQAENARQLQQTAREHQLQQAEANRQNQQQAQQQERNMGGMVR